MPRQAWFSRRYARRLIGHGEARRFRFASRGLGFECVHGYLRDRRGINPLGIGGRIGLLALRRHPDGPSQRGPALVIELATTRPGSDSGRGLFPCRHRRRQPRHAPREVYLVACWGQRHIVSWNMWKQPVRCATCSAGQLPGTWPERFLTSETVVQVGAHLAPRNRLARDDDPGIPLLSDPVEIATPFLVISLFGDGLEDKAVRGFAQAFRHCRHAGLEMCRKVNRGGGHTQRSSEDMFNVAPSRYIRKLAPSKVLAVWEQRPMNTVVQTVWTGRCGTPGVRSNAVLRGTNTVAGEFLSGIKSEDDTAIAALDFDRVAGADSDLPVSTRRAAGPGEGRATSSRVNWNSRR